ncbi:hypothetical protein FYJ43_02100 [Cutibacterium sp. WCA-380-WT-3A]|uniref:PH domain-containing protein n=2 Tax=Cutibacterium porci TaxID=2605781 RepID=A0A7K0J4U7_9ACTN|nr:hypothetical protein [Cutibacterium porci]
MTMTAEPLTFTHPWASQPSDQPVAYAPDEQSTQDPASPQRLRPPRKWIRRGLIIAVITTPFLWWVISKPGDYPILSIGCQLSVTLPGYIMIVYGLFYRTHIDDDTISIHIGPFRRTIDARSITKLAITPNCYLITDGSGRRLRINHHAHDVDRALLHLLTTLHTRPIDLPEGSPDHPDWPTWAQHWRNIFATAIYDHHTSYYATHPDALVQLNTLVRPPTV